MLKFVRQPHTHKISVARKSQNVLFVSQWFRHLIQHVSQAPLLQEALDTLIPYRHPWLGNVRLTTWAKLHYGSEWEFDPLTHHTSEILRDMNCDNTTLANELQLLWAGDPKDGTSHSSYRNRAREVARVCADTMDHDPGSIDVQIIERADDNDGFQILNMIITNYTLRWNIVKRGVLLRWNNDDLRWNNDGIFALVQPSQVH